MLLVLDRGSKFVRMRTNRSPSPLYYFYKTGRAQAPAGTPARTRRRRARTPHPSPGSRHVATALAAAAAPALAALALLHRSSVAFVGVFPVLLVAALLTDRVLVLQTGLPLSVPDRRIVTVLSLAVLGNLYAACFHASLQQAAALLAAVGASVVWPAVLRKSGVAIVPTSGLIHTI